MNSGYHPIDCALHDELQLRVMRGRPVDVVLDDGHGSGRAWSGRLVDVFSRDGAEYLRLDDGVDVRLDRILAVDGIPFRRDGC